MIAPRFILRYIGTGSKGNSCLIKVDDTGILIDAGINPADFPRDIILTDIDAVLISHGHGDHSKYVKTFSDKYQIKIFAPGDVLENQGVSSRSSVNIEGLRVIRVGNMTVVPFNVMHDVEGSTAFLIRNELSHRTLAFIPECGNLMGINIEEVDFFAVEANYDSKTIFDNYMNGKIEKDLYERITGLYGHMDIEDTLKFLSGYKYHLAILHNMSERNLNKEIKLPDRTQFAVTGKEYIL